MILTASTTAVVASLGAPLVPQIALDHHVPLASAQWVLTVTFLTGAVATPLMGRVGAGRHRRAVILVGVAVVFLGGILAALPLGFAAMILGRMLQGIGLGLAPLTFALARERVDETRQAAAMAALSVTVVAAAGLGYPIASAIVTFFDVGAAYWAGAVLSAITLIACWLWIPEGTPSDHVRVDLVGAVLLGGGSALLLLVMSQIHLWGALGRQTLTLGMLALAVLALWLRWTLRHPYPLVDVRLASSPGVLGANATSILAGCGLYMVVTMVVVLVQAPRASGYGLGESTIFAGLMLVPLSLTSVLSSRLRHHVTGWVGEDHQLSFGSAWIVLAAVWLMFFRDHLWQTGTGMALTGVGSGIAFAAMPGLVMRFVPVAEMGSAMSFNTILRMIGFSTGSALAIAVLEGASGGTDLTDSGFTWAFLAAAIVAGLAVLVAYGHGRKRGGFSVGADQSG